MKRAAKRVLLVIMAAVLGLAVAAAGSMAGASYQTRVLYPSQDNTLIESSTGELSNGAGPALFVGRTNQLENNLRRGLIAFDVAADLPAGAKVKSVMLTLTLEQTHAGDETIAVHRLLKAWGEGGSSHRGGRGAAAAAGDATWIHRFFDRDAWATPGGDFARRASAVQTVGDAGRYTWGSTSRLVKDVRRWLKSPEENFGWVLIGNESAAKTAKRFASRENGETSIQPQLTVSFKLRR